MEYRTLGATNLRVSVIGFGGAEIGYENASPAEVDRIVNAALEAGINVFDTAECYVDSEQKLGVALKGRRDQVFVFTKCGHASGLPGNDWDPQMLEKSIDRSLQHLQTDYVDLIQLHSCSKETLEQGDVIRVLQNARDAGKARFIGYSGDSADAEFAVRTGVFNTLQTSVNIADQEAIHRTLPLASQAGMGVIAKRPIANAAWKWPSLPANDYHREYWRRLQDLSYPFLEDGTAVATALRFTLAVPGVTMAIVGTKSPERFTQNTKIIDMGPLPESEWQSIRTRWEKIAQNDWVGQV
jgi:aryl-alcohol dehydrogenase-like predicted oxidoreductase